MWSIMADAFNQTNSQLLLTDGTSLFVNGGSGIGMYTDDVLTQISTSPALTQFQVYKGDVYYANSSGGTGYVYKFNGSTWDTVHSRATPGSPRFLCGVNDMFVIWYYFDGANHTNFSWSADGVSWTDDSVTFADSSGMDYSNINLLNAYLMWTSESDNVIVQLAKYGQYTESAIYEFSNGTFTPLTGNTGDPSSLTVALVAVNQDKNWVYTGGLFKWTTDWNTYTAPTNLDLRPAMSVNCPVTFAVRDDGDGYRSVYSFDSDNNQWVEDYNHIDSWDSWRIICVCRTNDGTVYGLFDAEYDSTRYAYLRDGTMAGTNYSKGAAAPEPPPTPPTPGSSKLYFGYDSLPSWTYIRIPRG